MKDFGRIFTLFILSFLYLSPGGTLLLEGRKDQVMSDGSDPATLPFSYSVIIDHAHNNMKNLFFGAVPTERLNPPEGFSIWVTWLEKAVVSFFSPVVTVEQLSTLFTWIQFFLGAVGFYCLALTMGWSRVVGFALAICWAFSAYTRARAKVHPALAGTYFLPFAFLGLNLALQKRSVKSLLMGASALLLTITAAHYYLIILVFLAPWILLYIYLKADWKTQWKTLAPNLFAVVFPAVCFLAWSYLKPLPADWVKSETITYLKTGDAAPGEMHPFMTRFAAHFVDYFTGEIAIGTKDINLLRSALSQSVVTSMGDGNTHERSNGIRWFLWVGFAAALWLAKKRRSFYTDSEYKFVWFFAAFAAFTMWLSFEPHAFGLPTGPSAWLAKIMSQFRVPSRAGVFVHFGVLMIVGIFLNRWLELKPTKGKNSSAEIPWPKLRKWISMGGVLPLLAILELPPFLNAMPISPVVPLRTDLADNKPCGFGLYYPYVSGTWGLLEYYYFLQSMRGSRCKIVNAATDTVSDRNKLFMQKMPLHPKYLELIRQQPEAAKGQLLHLAQCMPLDWIVFDKQIPSEFSRDVCSRLGFQMTSSDTCRFLGEERTPQRTAESCIR